jgi:hypothetical protein
MRSQNATFWIVAAAIAILVMGSIGGVAGAENHKNLLVLPVRVISESPETPDLMKDDFELFINDEERKIHSLRSRSRSLGVQSVLGRNYILSFQLAEYRKDILDAVSLFVTQSLTPSDVLIVVTPLKVYPLEVSVNKARLIGRIEKVLKQDLDKYQKQRTAMEKNLEAALDRVRTSFSDSFESQKYGVYQYQEAVRFLNTFPKAFSNFKKQFLLPHGGQFDKIASLFGERGGERWWIHFQLRELSPLFSKIRRVIGVLREWEGFSANVLPYEQGFDHLKKQLIFGDSFALDKNLHTLLSADICYNVVLLGQHVEMDATHKEMADLETLLGSLVVKSGGRMVSVSEPRKGIGEMYTFQDCYYELFTPFNGVFREKRIRIDINKPGVKPVYRDVLTGEDVEALMAINKVEGPQIGSVRVDSRRVHFTIGNFNRNTDGQFGIIKVMVGLLDENRQWVYNTENTLRAVKKQIAVSLPLPLSCKGSLVLKITALDLIANRLSEQEVPVQLQ